MARTPLLRSITVTAVGALALGIGLPAMAAAGDDPGGQQECMDDAAGDTQDYADDSAITEPRADVTRFCVTSGPTSTFHVSVAQVTDPATDAGWQGASFIGWYVDTTGDDVGDFFIDVSLNGDGSGADEAVVKDVRGDDPDNTPMTCTAGVAVTASGISVFGVDADDCLAGATSATASVGVYYDNGTEVAYDFGNGMVTPKTLAAQRTIGRLLGANRTETSVKISQRQFAPGDAARVYLARSDVFADASVGGVLTDGPILIVPSCGDAPQVVLDEITRLDVATVTALGGTSAICEQMLDSAATGRTKQRVGGRTRFETSVAIAKRAFPTADRVYVARSDDFIDAVTGGTLTDGPILLVPRCGSVPAIITATIAGYDPDDVIALGGTAAVCDATLSQAAGGHTTGRLAGSNRFETAAAIARAAFPEPTGAVVYLARADLVVDALAGGVLTDGPILIVPSCGDLANNPTLGVIRDELSRQGATSVLALGGSNAVCTATLATAGEY